ncbi:sporulation integral membrane protein YtvI [Paenibacillus mucilaginosus]|uniref:Sporulation integral membrane protein YtvI n=1 Tax=Paenibacillus mucilaginosus (strain KNP414) TaxID=1036673 RepID=F8FF50_PAEMK|nr:sporulation integral membrane protein YtvI [Paenibacillus mucilaginosus]AEI39750.1 sporulation integral membrane protein YtvI [Paenibacillus mucilaginosus KNP414]MCG7217393.1 sporulation integral membrane protein YtvI [Paenibacillus mucilaginosus]WDM29036.1 sporulation integral membrane protein YtvI [Paenibacillus mucilaginosus]
MPLRTLLFCAISALLLYGLFTTGFPFLLAVLIAILIEPVVAAMMKYLKFGRVPAAVIACTLYTSLFMGFVYLVGFKMVSELVQFAKNMPDYLNNAVTLFNDTTAKTELLYEALPTGMAEQVQKWLGSGVGALTESLKSIFAGVSRYSLGVAKTIPSLFIFFVVFVIGLYLISLSLPKLYQSFLGLFDQNSRAKVATVLVDLRRAIFGFILAQFIISLLTYIVTLIGLLILGVDYPMAIALLIVLVDILPVLGVSAVLFPWAGYSFLVGDSHLAIGLLVLFLVILIFRRIIEPKIIGDAVGINALAALISIYVGFKLMGAIGLILGPVMVIVYSALRRVGLLKINIKLDN